MGALQEIEHVVVLMLENRSFDSMLGKLYPRSYGYEGLSGSETNLYTAAAMPMPVWNDTGMGPATACIPDPDPGELFVDMNMQLFGGARAAAPPPMAGFVDNYMAQPQTDGRHDPMAVMHYFTPEQVPVISALAKAFGVCDQWYASAPCQTWPNRFFVHTGTALGWVNNSNFHIPFPAESIFSRLSRAGKTWRVYFHDAPQSILLGDVWLEAPLRYRFFSQFLVDAAVGTLPNYSFIEPRYFTDLFDAAIPNDEHPPHNVVYGEQLIAAVYNAVRASPCWKKTLLVVTYDEHGGSYDHMPPPAAVPPDACRQDGFAFDAYGIRVPTVIVSPFIAPGSIVGAVPGRPPSKGPPYPFDHTSIIATLRKLFDLGDPLTNRDAVAPDLLGALSLERPENDGPARIDAAAVLPSRAELQTRAAAPLNHMQAALSQMAAHLPTGALAGVAAMPSPQPMTAAPAESVTRAAVDAVDRVKSFLGL